MVSAERWQEVERVFHEALEQRADDRAAWLARVCAGDDDLREEVQSLLQYQEQAEGFIESPALVLAAEMHAAERAAAAITGQTLHQYRITALLGSGGMGEVYLAEDMRLQRRVALKLLPVDLSHDRNHLRRFEREARAIAALSHPNVCAIHEVIETTDGRQCIVMEHVDGITLRKRLAGGAMTIPESLDVTIQIASALSAAHAAGVVHRDIKPENILLRDDGYVKVVDFGLAKLTESRKDSTARSWTDGSTTPGVVMGTVRYMSPEQARGSDVDRRTDIWSLGVILYEMVAGQQPFTGVALSEVIDAIVDGEPVPLAVLAREVPPQLAEIVATALQKKPDDRYSSANELLADARQLKQQFDHSAAVRRSTRFVEDPLAASEAQIATHVLVHANRELPLHEGENIVGRETAARVRFASASVSRHHASILVAGDTATVVDLGSKNGTFVDGERVDGPRVLADGETIRFGRMEMVYRSPGAERATEPLG